MTARPRIAIAHDYLTQRGGAERVVVSMLRAFPEASVHTLLYEPGATFPEFRDATVVASPLNRVGPVRRHHRAALPLLAPFAARVRVDADLTLISSSGWAHGFDVRGRSIVYCHNPARWLYQTDEYLGDSSSWSPKALGLRPLAPALRRWDLRAASSHDRYLANSSVVRQRIHTTYGIDAGLLFPPTGLDHVGSRRPVGPFDEGFYLVVSRLLPYKNVDQVIEAFRELPDERLLVIGRGPESERLQRLLPPNAALVSDVSDEQLRWAYGASRALVAPSHEDYGLTPLEAGTFGKPTIALRGGGYLDTIVEGTTGIFFDQVEPHAIARAVRDEQVVPWDPSAITEHTRGFDEDSFIGRLRDEVEQVLARDARTGRRS